MGIKRPVLLGSFTFGDIAGNPTDTVDVVTNVSEEFWIAMGSPVLDNTLLRGDVQQNLNGEFQYGKQGSFNGRTITVLTDGVTPKGYVQTYQMQVPEFFPNYLVDRFLANLTAPVANFVAFKNRGGRRTVVGSTIVSS